MAKRRGHNEGSISQRSDGRWQVRFWSTTPPRRRYTRHEQNLRWQCRSSWRVTVRAQTSHRSACASLILHRTTLRSIGGSSTDVFGLAPVRAR
jgi:hypothetical protein